jgi:predicted phage terminase large subunit-like protein
MTTSAKKTFLAIARIDLKAFIRQAFVTVHPGTEFVDNWHINAIVHCLEECIEGRMPRLIINLPPRQLKSFLVSVALPAFLLGQNPTAKIICVSYSDELARTLARDFRRIVEAAWYRKLFPAVKLSKCTEKEIYTTKGGFRYSTSVHGSLTGLGGDFIIIDDPMKSADANSDKLRESTNDWYRNTLLSRLDDKEYGVQILVMQRLHVNDLTGFVEAGGNFHKLSLPAVARREHRIRVGKGRFHTRKAGTALHPKREGLRVLEGLRKVMGSQKFSAQYQQSPDSPDGALFKRKWFNILHEPPKYRNGGHWYVSIDAAASTAETADYTAISIIYADERGYFVTAAGRGHWDYETLVAKAQRYRRDLVGPVEFVIEAASAGVSLIQTLRKGGISCFHYVPKGDKVYRASLAVPIIHSGRVHIVDQPGNNAWVRPYLNEFLTFPFGRYDDQVDSLVQLVDWAERRINPGATYAAFE